MDKQRKRMDWKHWLAAGLMAAMVWPVVLLAHAAKPGVTTVTLLHTHAAWDKVPYVAYPKGVPELTILKITIPAHGKLGWHKHPMPTAGYVVSGVITIEKADGTKRSFSAGQAIAETVNTYHRAEAGDSPAVLLVFYAGGKGMPLAEPKR